MKRKIFSKFVAIFLFFILLVVGIGVIVAQNNSGFLLSGRIFVPKNWLGGNVDNVWMVKKDEYSTNDVHNFEQVYFDSDGSLHGNFWIGTVGWATFKHGVNDQKAKIQCPSTLLTEQVHEQKNSKCPVVGSVWSENAGWIVLGKHAIKQGEGVYYNPNSANMEGFGWSESIGWVPIFSGLKHECDKPEKKDTPECICYNDPDDPSCKQEILDNDWYENIADKAAFSVNMIGRVAVLGNIAGTRIFEIANAYGYTNQDVGYNYATIQHAPILNRIRRNVAQITRNIPSDLNVGLKPHNGFIYYDKGDYCLGIECTWAGLSDNMLYHSGHNFGESEKKIDTFIVKGHNVIIDGDFNGGHFNNLTDDKTIKGIIVLADENGNGGNVYITKNTGQIYAYIFAEGSIFSGERRGDEYIKYLEKGPFNIPNKQLYINGLVISKNTIGANAHEKDLQSRCPVLARDCTNENASYYDWSYFRVHTQKGNLSLPGDRAHWVSDEVKNATVIIDQNSSILSNPPIGFENIQ